jgi:hypothetical protein
MSNWSISNPVGPPVLFRLSQKSEISSLRSPKEYDKNININILISNMGD